ncbi:oligopeptide/dipeptide ABC transporter ATP-binding protein [Inediibacterium massiliense]|uniref:oligopeptide/dipeptide ABC transporter ATP-binding protein n=1 Tax=Inediibacterium massiliense TaxID=1658111 RepID=UPI0006B5F130|nr:ABC transporter ATP-binding protein [Inediibacterium massiliense]
MSALIEINKVTKYYPKKRSFLKKENQICAVDDVSLKIEKGRTLALIGESGSGKTTLGKMIVGLEKPTGGQICFKKKDITQLSLKEMKPIRKDMQIIFQNSAGVFDPSYTIGESLKEILKNYFHMSKKESQWKVEEMLCAVGLNQTYVHRYINELSGGQKQRANIARALMIHPEFVVCDEPVSSLDYSLRKQILNLLNDMKDCFNTTYLFITHDLSNVSYISDCVAIMYKGSIVEYIDWTNNMDKSIRHPYTRLLFHSIPVKDPLHRKRRQLPIILEDVENILHERGCKFYGRCPYKTDQCKMEQPVLKEFEKGHKIACHNMEYI